MAAALDLPLPAGARLTAERVEDGASYALPTGPARGGPPPAETLTGTITARAWRLAGAGPPAQIVAPLRAALEAEGFEILLDCAAETCGGYDFRYGTEVLPPPDMHVDLGRFRFLSARRDTEDGTEAVGLLASRSADAGHLQAIRVTPAGAAPPAPAPASPPVAPAPDEADDLAALLERDGHAALPGLAFAPGRSTLGPGPHPALAALADWLAADPERRVALVGHTDLTGALKPNVALSRRRAQAVLDVLARDHGVARDRLRAEGAGWLAPRAGNATPEGREANRRVEAVVTAGG
ncbi:OmpA-OmpF porin, OOP family [Limimaricola pyoseonensis]|uniref:OmpA-OmpF porin, OOP family n=2 Tax=Limimaricola pyoseonensis TaxID=521013 RepID=A0A1G7F2V1_9RHOB|nr:OmpA-OmpF porin, OOP family [Limimaricola pyoseonensis]